jgi:hypothetical protein
MFFTYRQNNSGGGFYEDEVRGIGIMVIVEADNADEANARAKDIGLYFDGEGDCPCCGRRWRNAYPEEAGDEVPSLYGEPVEKYEATFPKWSDCTGYIHYKNGVIEKIP